MISIDPGPSLYTTGSLELHMEYPTNDPPILSPITGYDVQWLATEEVEKLGLSRNATSTIDIEALHSDAVHDINVQSCLFIEARGAVVRIDFRR
jgi:hypothetical protein